jgi:hypothetical protein
LLWESRDEGGIYYGFRWKDGNSIRLAVQELCSKLQKDHSVLFAALSHAAVATRFLTFVRTAYCATAEEWNICKQAQKRHGEKKKRKREHTKAKKEEKQKQREQEPAPMPMQILSAAAAVAADDVAATVVVGVTHAAAPMTTTNATPEPKGNSGIVAQEQGESDRGSKAPSAATRETLERTVDYLAFNTMGVKKFEDILWRWDQYKDGSTMKSRLENVIGLVRYRRIYAQDYADLDKARREGADT